MNNNILITLLVGLIIFCVFFVANDPLKRYIFDKTSTTKRKLNNETTIIIAGPKNAGKTSLFNFLVSGDPRFTLMSQKPNIISNFVQCTSSGNTKIRLIDFPGHTKLRYMIYKALNESSGIKGLIFMIDSTSDPREIEDTAELLYEILNITERRGNAIDILLACNKSEMFTSRPPKKFLTALEHDIGEIINRKKKNLGSISLRPASDLEADDDNEVFLQCGDSGFKFSSLKGSFNVFEGSVLQRKIHKWESWLDKTLSK